MSYDLVTGDAASLTDRLNGAVVLGPIPYEGAALGALTLIFSSPSHTVTFSGSAGELRTAVEVVSEILAVFTTLHGEIRRNYLGDSYIALWHEDGFTIDKDGTANPLLRIDTAADTTTAGPVDVNRIRGFSNSISGAGYTLVLGDEAGPGPGAVSSDDVINESDVTGASVTAALNRLGALAQAPVATIAALSALPNSLEGVTVRVLSVRDYWVSTNRSTPRAVASAMVAAHASGGNWRWERLCVPDPSWLVETVWEVDTALGNDENDGRTWVAITGGTALQSFAEVMRRCAGSGGVWDAGQLGATTVTVNLRGNGHVLVGKIHVRNGLKFILNGVRTVATTGITVGAAKQDLNRATNAYAQVPSTWTVATEVGRLLRDVTNSRYSWVFADVAGSPGVDDTALIPPWCTLNEVGTPGVTNGNTTVGAQLETYTLPTVTNYQLSVSGTAGSTSSFTIQNLEVTSAAGTSRAFSENAQLFYQNVKINGNIRFGFGTHILQNCWFAGDGAYAIDAAAYVRILSGVCTVAWVSNAASRPHCTIELRNDVLLGAQIVAPYGGVLRILDAWFRNVTTCILATHRSQVIIGGSAAGSLNGTGNTTAIALNNSCDMTFTSGTAFNISSTNGITMGGATTARAWDDTVPAYTAARTMSFANLVATVAGGGFGSKIVDPVSGCRAVIDA